MILCKTVKIHINVSVVGYVTSVPVPQDTGAGKLLESETSLVCKWAPSQPGLHGETLLRQLKLTQVNRFLTTLGKSDKDQWLLKNILLTKTKRMSARINSNCNYYNTLSTHKLW